MKTRNISARTGSGTQSVSSKTKLLPHNPKTRQSFQKHNVINMLSENQTPIVTRKKFQSAVENMRENYVNVNDVASPIIGARRRALIQSKLKNVTNMCEKQRSGLNKEKKIPLKSTDNSQGNEISPVEEGMNKNIRLKENVRKNSKKKEIRKENVECEKENVLVTGETSVPLRKSSRIRKPPKSIYDEDTCSPVKRKSTNKKQLEAGENNVNRKGLKEILKPVNKKETENKIIPEENKVNKKESSSLHTNRKKEKTKENIQQQTDCRRFNANSKITPSENAIATKLTGKEDCLVGTKTDNENVQSVRCTMNEKEDTAIKGTTLPPRRSKRSREADRDKNTMKIIKIGKGDETPKTSNTPGETMLPHRRAKRSRETYKNDNTMKANKDGKRNVTPKISNAQNKNVKCISPAKPNKNKIKQCNLRRKSQNTSHNVHSSSSSESQGGTQGKFKTPIDVSTTGIKVTPNERRKSRNTSKNIEPNSISENQVKSKPPVWASVRGEKITPGKRKSFRINSDTYEFPSSPTKAQKEVKRRKVTKPRKQEKKRMKPSTKCRLLVTDLSWRDTASKNMPFLGASSISRTKTVASTASFNCHNNSTNDGGDEASIPSIISSIRDEVSAEEMIGFDMEDSCDSNDVFPEFEGETRSSFVVTDKNKNNDNNEVIPMTSVSVIPTPAVSKHISKYIGGSSTPRIDNIPLSAHDQGEEAANDSIAQCFGFESEPEDESELNISPVQKSRSRHALEVTGTSEVNDGELHPATLPSRFSWSSLRPGYHSKTSISCSSSMVTQGRSTTMSNTSVHSQRSGGVSLPTRFSLNINHSHKSQPRIKSFTVPSTVKQFQKSAKREKLCKSKLENIAQKKQECSNSNAGETTILFDENELLEKESTEDENQNGVSNINKKTSASTAEPSNHSPEKHFAKAPRKSYDRAALVEARRKFIEMHGGYDNTEDDETEKEEEELQVKHQSKNRKKPTKSTKKKEKKQEKIAGPSKNVNSSTLKKKKENEQFDVSVEEWASHLNDHFSEVEESFLVVI